MYTFQASVHHAALQASCLQQGPGTLEPEMILGMHAKPSGPTARNRDRIAVCVHTFIEYQLRGRAWLS
jgi:hypothetical protein